MTIGTRGPLRRANAVTAVLGAAVLVATTLATLMFGTPANASAASAATLAAANIGTSAGTCASHPTTNSLGGSQYEHSCAGGYSGGPEYWCADFAMWVWANSGFNTSGLTAAAQSFRTYGQSHGTLHGSAQPGDAIVYSSSQDGYANHVAIVTAVNSDGSVVTANGDWGGQSGTMAHFAITSSVVKITIPAAQASTGSWVPAANYYITAIVGPSGTSSPPGSGGNPYSASGVCGNGYGVVDSHHITGATIFLLYDDASGDNCVVTLADTVAGAVAMNATLAVQGGASASNPGNFAAYAGPVYEYAPNSCIKWGGTYKTTTWTSDYSHCGAGNGSPPPATANPYSAGEVCGSGYDVVDHHALTDAMVYLLHSDATGDDCVVTLADDGTAGAVAMNATLAVQGGASASNPGTFTYYAGPVYESAPNSCVKWGGTYKTSTWTSEYGHCGGSGGTTADPYTPAGVCGSGYSVIDSHDLGSATVYLLYSAGTNCVVTLVHNGAGAVGLNATLSVEGGSSASNPGLFQWYAGPVRLAAASACVKWGGSYESTSWTSAWSHCG